MALLPSKFLCRQVQKAHSVLVFLQCFQQESVIWRAFHWFLFLFIPPCFAWDSSCGESTPNTIGSWYKPYNLEIKIFNLHSANTQRSVYQSLPIWTNTWESSYLSVCLIRRKAIEKLKMAFLEPNKISFIINWLFWIQETDIFHQNRRVSSYRTETRTPVKCTPRYILRMAREGFQVWNFPYLDRGQVDEQRR